MVDLSFLQKFAKGDTKKMKRYVNIYLSITPGIFKQMQQHVIDEDWEQLRIKAHSLKPQTDYMGIPSLKSVLIEIEQNVQKEEFRVLNKLVDFASRIHTESIPFLKEFILTS